jgi:tetratricopeptide (TPR) repeat protein
VKPARAEAALLAALLLFVAGRCLVPMDETDVFFNLRLGEVVLGAHAVPRTNLLSFTFPDAPDPNLAWLFQVLLALVHRAAGIPGTVVLKTAFVVATFAILFRVARRRGAHPAAAAAALALAAWAAEPRFVERPHLVTFLGLACTLLALERAEAGRPRALVALVPCGLVWANANSCFFLAPAVLLLHAAGALLDGRRADARRAALVAAALAPLILATPSGLDALRYIANHFRMPSLRPLQEYRHAAWPVDGPFVFLAALLLAAAGARRGPWRHVLPALALGALGALRIRFVAEFALLAAPIVGAAVPAAAAPSDRRAAAASTLVTLAALLGLAVVPRALAARDGGRWLDVGMEPDLVPATAIRFANENGLRDRMYNDLEVGSYLTWEGWPRRRVFQDPRINGYPDEMHAVLRRTDLSRDQWERFLARFGVTAALITYPDENPRAALFDPERWALVYRAPDGLVFARRGPERAALATARELPVTFARAADGGVEARALEARPAASPVPDCVWRQRLGDFFVEAGDDRRARDAYAGALPCLPGPARAADALALGDAALRMGDRAAAADAYAGLDDPAARTRRGLALLALGRAGEALADLAAARRDRPADPDARLGEALALSALGRRAEARLALRAFLALAPPGHAGAARARAELARLDDMRP